MIRILFFVICLIGASILHAKEINFKLLNKANNSFVFSTYNGTKLDTLAIGKTDFMGNGSMKIPTKYENIPFMGVLTFEDKDAMDLIVAEGSFSFKDSNGSLVFDGSLENDVFYNRKNEINIKENEEKFVSKYVNLMTAVLKMGQLVYNQAQINMQNSTMARVNALNQIDVSKMYYTKFWNLGLNGFLVLAPSEQAFANDMIRLLDKTDSDIVYNALVNDLITITNQYGYEDAFDSIMKHVIEGERIKYPQGKIFEAFEMMKVSKGNKIPNLDGVELNNEGEDAVILVFHQPDCSHCVSELEKLVKMYPELSKNKIRVISISAAVSKHEFEEETKAFLWKDKISDFKGFGAGNFSKFGVIGTPTIYLVDNTGIVLGRFPSVDALKHFIDNSLQNK